MERNHPICQSSSDGAALRASVELFSAYPDLLTPTHISELTGFTVEYVRKLCREHKIPAVQVGGRQWFVPKPRFVEYVMGGDA